MAQGEVTLVDGHGGSIQPKEIQNPMNSSTADITNEEAVKNEKAKLRAACVANRKRLPELHPDASEALSQQVMSVIESPPIGIVAGYVALPGELDPAIALDALSAEAVTLALPVADNEPSVMQFRRWVPGEALAGGPLGPVHPGVSAPVVDPDVVLLPLVAFDRKGHRLGMGQGYYDRTLAHLRQQKNIAAYGIGFDEQEVDRVPSGSFDQLLDGIITPTRFVKPAAQP